MAILLMLVAALAGQTLLAADGSTGTGYRMWRGTNVQTMRAGVVLPPSCAARNTATSQLIAPGDLYFRLADNTIWFCRVGEWALVTVYLGGNPPPVTPLTLPPSRLRITITGPGMFSRDDEG